MSESPQLPHRAGKIDSIEGRFECIKPQTAPHDESLSDT